MTSTPIHLKFFVTAKKLALVAVLQVMLEFWCQNISGAGSWTCAEGAITAKNVDIRLMVTK